MTDVEQELLDFQRSIYRPTPEESVTQWCEANLWLGERQTEMAGPFSLALRPYLREPLEDFKSRAVDEITLCFGSQTGKTTLCMAGLAWSLVNAPAPGLWILPSTDLARSFSKTRWRPFIEDSECLRGEMPDRADQFTNLEQHFKRATINFVGSNSTAQLSSRPIGILIADEIDKFARATDREAAALPQAEQRTKGYATSKIFRASTPSIEDGEIWQCYMRGDQRRFHVPCPHCEAWIVFEWSGVKWDRAARMRETEWDLGRVDATAHYECPQCKGTIDDWQKIAMLSRGQWRPTNPSALPRERSYHLSSLYSPDRKCTWGSLAVRFLQDKSSLLGLQSFVNGYLAEPWREDIYIDVGERIELISPASAPALGDKPVRVMSVDVQASTPHFYWIVREWTAEGHSRAIAIGTCDIWEDLRQIQLQHEVPDHCAIIDSGFDASAVYTECLRHGKVIQRAPQVPLHIGWIPAKGMARRGWRDEKLGLEVPFYCRHVDPMLGDSRGRAGRLAITLLEFSSDTAKDILARLRKQELPIRWEVAQGAMTNQYWQHMDSERKIARYSSSTGRTFHTWTLRTSRAPNHWFDCEVLQVAFALFRRWLQLAARQ